MIYIRTLAQHIANTLKARNNCRANDNRAWENRHNDRLNALEKFLPSGSGIDAGTKLDDARSTPTRLVLTLSFHHMDEHGSYDGWTDHEAIITPAFDGLDVRITGRNRNDIKDYLADVLHVALTQRLNSNENDTYTLEK